MSLNALFSHKLNTAYKNLFTENHLSMLMNQLRYKQRQSFNSFAMVNLSFSQYFDRLGYLLSQFS